MLLWRGGLTAWRGVGKFALKHDFISSFLAALCLKCNVVCLKLEADRGRKAKRVSLTETSQ